MKYTKTKSINSDLLLVSRQCFIFQVRHETAPVVTVCLVVVFWFIWMSCPCVSPLFQLPLCVFSLRYLTCPLPSSPASPVPDPLVSVSEVVAVRSPCTLSASVRLFVMFCGVSCCLSPIGVFGFWFRVPLCDSNFAFFFALCLVFSCYLSCGFFLSLLVFVPFSLLKSSLLLCPMCVCVWVHV